LTEHLRILLVAPVKWYNAEAEYVFRLAKGLRAKGHKPVVMGIPASPLLNHAAQDQITTCDRFKISSLNPVLLKREMRQLLVYLEENHFDLINVHRSEGFIIMARAAHSLKPRPAIIRTRGDMRPVRTDPLNRRLYSKWTDYIITSNKLLEQELIIRLGLHPRKIKTIYLGIDPDELKPDKEHHQARKDLGLEPHQQVVALMGRIGPTKGHQYLLQAAPQILSEFPDARFILIYPDVEKESTFLQTLTRSKLKDKFILIGSNSNRANAMQLADVAVIPSLGSEANCRAALEWMALRKPVVGARVGVIPELIVPAETGYLIHPRQSQPLADAVIKILKHPDRKREMGEKAYQRLRKKFTQDKMLEETMDTYRSIIEKSGPP
jgi:glycosyltransferase involved in cell wall biosynthesis